ncbi:hypothetical protein [Halegenticoccus soli]|uniref:hypothetical protein n=1 Tax=Halegenticoccus soli TaxID=1985678 RepID=UPI00130439E8|nr:hypothetical protein [Halegenticoccus soli]
MTGRVPRRPGGDSATGSEDERTPVEALMEHAWDAHRIAVDPAEVAEMGVRG